MKKILLENTIKNTLILILLLILYKPMQDLFTNIGSEHYGNLLVTTSLLIMAVLFADYAFTYAHTKMKSPIDRYFSHSITFIIMLCTGLMLESVMILINLETGVNVWIITFVSAAFFLSLIMYDYWDILRAKSE